MHIVRVKNIFPGRYAEIQQHNGPKAALRHFQQDVGSRADVRIEHFDNDGNWTPVLTAYLPDLALSFDKTDAIANISGQGATPQEALSDLLGCLLNADRQFTRPEEQQNAGPVFLVVGNRGEKPHTLVRAVRPIYDGTNVVQVRLDA